MSADDLPTGVDRFIDQACNRYEAAWRVGTPRIEDFLTDVPAQHRPGLLRELVALELHYRRGRGEEFGPEEYLARFPELDTRALADAVEKVSTKAEGPGRPPEPPPDRIAGYELLGTLGRGGMGVVYKARQVKADRIVALKMILAAAGADEGELARFRTEVEAVARLQHPNIVQIYEVGEAAGRPFFSMEFCAGGNLATRLDGPPLPPDDAARLAETLARAVAAAHAGGVIHRDLKPANVLLASPVASVPGERPDERRRSSPGADATGLALLVPKIGDFGLAKRLDNDSGQTRSGAILGTPSYMAPEQAEGETKNVGPLADVYALGAILYECLTGRPPFKAATVLDTLVQVRTRDPVAVRQLQPGVPRDLETICLKCLRKDAKTRYASAQALAEDLRRVLSGQPIQARPVSAAERAWKWVRRHPVVAGLALALVVALAGGFVGVFSQWRRAEANFTRANDERQRAESSFRLAREAVDRMLTEVAEERLRNLPGLDEVRGRLLAEAVGFYEKFLIEHGEEPSLRADTARAHFRLGQSYALLGRYEEAEKSFLRAVESQQFLLDRLPEEPRHVKDLAETYLQFGALYLAQGKPGQAEPLLTHGLALHETVSADPEEDAESARVRANLFSRLSLTCNMTGRPKEAEEYLQRAVAIARPLAARHPSRQEYAFTLARAVNNLGVLYKETGQYPRAGAAFREAIAVWEKILYAEPGLPEIQAALATSFFALGSLEYYYLGQPSQAEKPFLRSLELCERVVQAHPSVASFKKDLARAHWALAWLHLRLNRPEQGAAAGGRARQLQEELVAAHPGTPAYASDLAATYQFLGWFHSSRRDLREAHEAYVKARGILRQLAGSHREVAEYRQRLSQVLHDLGILYRERYRDADRAEVCYLEAAALREGLARATPADSQLQDDLAWTWDKLSMVYLATRQQGKADAAFDKAHAIREKLAREHPGVLKYAHSHTVSCTSMGKRLREAKKPAEALPWFDRAIERLQPILEREPKARESQDALLFAYWERATAKMALDRDSVALADWDCALALDAGAYRRPLAAGRAVALARLGRHGEAVGTAESLLTDKALTPILLYRIAGVYSLSSEAAWKDLALEAAERERRTERYREKALDLLRKAQARGFFRTRADILGVTETPALTPLHKDPRFRAWLDRLARTKNAKEE